MEKTPPPRKEMEPLALSLLGRAMVKVGVSSGDLSLVRDGKQYQARAAEAGATPTASSNPPKRP
jgi:hypothetical protein